MTALSAGALIRVAFDVISAIWPNLLNALRGGTHREVLENALRASIAAAERAAVMRVESRAGRVVNPLRVLAVQLDDVADELALHDQLDDARTLRAIAESYREVAPIDSAG